MYLCPKAVRRAILRMAKAGDYGHIGPSFSLVEILIAVTERMAEQDVLLLSKGHGVQAWYGVQYVKGELGDADIDGFLRNGSALRGVSPFGALGHGLPVGVGMALADRSRRIYVVVGDGELNEGSCWEAIMTAAQWRLSNLHVLVDQNGYQAMGPTQDVIAMEPLRDKFEVFGWLAQDVTAGNSTEAIRKGFSRVYDMRDSYYHPKALVCRTTKGQGVSFMKNQNDWHYRKLTPELYDAAMGELV